MPGVIADPSSLSSLEPQRTLGARGLRIRPSPLLPEITECDAELVPAALCEVEVNDPGPQGGGEAEEGGDTDPLQKERHDGGYRDNFFDRDFQIQFFC